MAKATLKLKAMAESLLESLTLNSGISKEKCNSKLPKYTPPEPPPRSESTVKKYRVLFDNGSDMIINKAAFNDLSVSLKINPHSDDIILNCGVYIKSLDSIKSISPIESCYGV